MALPYSDHRHMPRGYPRRRPQKAVQRLFIGQWVRALGKRPVDVVRATGINEGYLSELIGGTKTNPSTALLRQIGDSLGIKWHYLYEPPPSKEFIRTATTLDPATLARLMDAQPRNGPNGELVPKK